MAKTKIDWADWTWNPVWGCLNQCPYCYARKIAKRFGDKKACNDSDMVNAECEAHKFGEKLSRFAPTWLVSNFNKPFPKKPSVIFVNSMSDIAYWKPDWMARVVDIIRENLQHTFIMLTKDGHIFDNGRLDRLWNLKIGLTIDGTNDEWDTGKWWFEFVNFEPLQAEIDEFYLDFIMNESGVEWVIIGAETGNRKGKIVPERQWIKDIVEAARESGVPLWMKDNLKGVWCAELIREHAYRETNHV